MNIEQEIFDDFKSLSESGVSKRLTYGQANAHFGTVYEDFTGLVHGGKSKKLLYDEDFRINQFLLNSDYKNVDWAVLEKLYPVRQISDGHISTIRFLEIRDRLIQKIPNELIAREYLMGIRWPSGVACPFCESKNNCCFGSGPRSGIEFRCRTCWRHFSV